MLNRREMLEGMAAAGVACVLPGPGAGVLPVPDIVARVQWLGGVSRLGEGDVEHARDTATRLAVAYAASPNPQVRYAAGAHAYTLLDRLKLGPAHMRDETRTQLMAVASDAVALAGYGQLDAGRLEKAGAWFNKALELAQEAGDKRREALTIASTAWLFLFGAEPDRAAALEALEAAAKFQRFLPPGGRAWVFGYLAREYAMLGDDLVSGRFLEQAHAAAVRIPHDEPGWGWWSAPGEFDALDGTRLEVFTGRRSLLLGRPTEALARFDSALDSTPAPVRRAGLHENVMGACIALDDPERACVSAMAALAEAEAYELASFPPMVLKTRETFLKEWRGLAVVRELDERLRLAA